MKNTKKKQDVALSSVAASGFLTIIKLVVGILSGSMGIISEAAHSALDLIAAMITFFAVKWGDEPADSDHHYGHEKIESISALIETGLLFLTSVWIIYEAILRLMSGKTEIETSWYAFAVILISIIVDISRSGALRKVAKETNSQALEADALHFSSDILSSAVVLIGLVLVSLGIKSADSIAAIGVSIFVARAGYSLGKRTIDVLIDTAPAGLREKILELAAQVDGIQEVKKIKTRLLGSAAFAELTIGVDAGMTLKDAYIFAKTVEQKMRAEIPELDIEVHAVPK